MSTEHLFSTEDVLSLIESSDGDYNDGLNAHVSAFQHNGHLHVELTPVENGETLIGTEKFRVTVERISQRPSVNAMSSDVYIDSLEYEDSALDEMGAQQ